MKEEIEFLYATTKKLTELLSDIECRLRVIENQLKNDI